MADSLLGKHLGRYEIYALLGVGGMARVYTAFDHILEREVALKVLHTSAQQADAAERFRREAQTLASLRHPNIVHVYDYGQHGDLRFIVEQLLPGPTLEHELAALAAQDCVMAQASVHQILLQLADVLDYAHSRKLIHRDLKPSNIIRNERGDVVVTDFGIAKALTAPLTKTQTGWILGTPAYLSPEQARGSPPLSPASDIYTLGVILFELLTGRVPFNDAQPMEVLLGHIQKPPPSLRSLRPGLPPSAERVVLRALAKEPAARYASAGTLAQALITAWPTKPKQSIHSQPTRANPRPPVVSKRSLSAPSVPTLRPAWQRHVRTGFAFMTLPVTLMMVVALFFLGLPAQRPPDTIPTTTTQTSEPAIAVGSPSFMANTAIATIPEPTTATTLELPFTTTPESTFTTTPAPTFTATPAPTFTTPPESTFTTTPAPTFTTTPAPTFTTTPAPTLAPTTPTTVPASAPAPAPQPTLKEPDF